MNWQTPQVKVDQKMLIPVFQPLPQRGDDSSIANQLGTAFGLVLVHPELRACCTQVRRCLALVCCRPCHMPMCTTTQYQVFFLSHRALMHLSS